MHVKLVSLFSGIGAFEKGLDKAKIPYELLNFSEIEEYAIEAYCAIHNEGIEKNLGDVSKIEDTELPEGIDLLTYGFPCFVGDTLVLTDRGYVEIRDIKVNDKVLSHDNKYHKVTHFLEQGVKEINNVKIMGSHELRVTKNHLFYTRLRYKDWNNAIRKYERKFKPVEWVRCDELTKDHYVGYAINTESKNIKWAGVEYKRANTSYIQNELPVKDKRFWYLCGRFIGDGWTKSRLDRGEGGISGAVISCRKSKLEKLNSIVGDLFHYTIDEGKSVYKLHFSNKELGIFLSKFGKGAENKYIPKEILDLPLELLEMLLEGYFDSDGSIKNGLICVTTVSRKLAYGIGQCIAKVYKRPFSIHYAKRPDTCVIEGRVVNQRATYTVAFKKETGKQDQSFYEDGYIWSPVRSVENTGKKEETYDITVDRSHSFTANGHIVHNCQDLSTSGKGLGIVKGETRSGLLYEALRIISVRKPKVAIAENVKNLVSKRYIKDFENMLKELEGMGYTNYWYILDSKDFGLAQVRERVFVVSILKELDEGMVAEIKGYGTKVRLGDFLDKEPRAKYLLNPSIGVGIKEKEDQQEYIGQAVRLGGLYDKEGKKRQAGSVWSKEGLAPTIGTCQGGNTEPLVVVDEGIRRLSPKEVWALQGFSGDAYERAKARLEQQFYKGGDRSDSRMYKMGGNSISVPVVAELFKEIYKNKKLMSGVDSDVKI